MAPIVKQSTILSVPDTKGAVLRAEANAHGRGAPDGVGMLSFAGSNRNGIDPYFIGRLYQESPVVNSLIDIGASAIACRKFRVGVLDNSNVFTEIFKAQPYNLLSYINSHTTVYEFLYSWYAFKKLYGVVYIAMEPTDGPYAKHTSMSLWMLNPLYVSKKTLPDGSCVYLYRPDGSKEGIAFGEVFVIEDRAFNPLDTWLPNVNIASLTIDSNLIKFAKTQMASYYQHAAKLSGVIEMEETLEDDDIEKIKRQVKDQYSGVTNHFRTMILDKGKKYTPLQGNGSAEHISDVVAGSLDAHAMVLGVPIGLASGNISKSGLAMELEALMWTRNLIPFGTNACALLNKHLSEPMNFLAAERKMGQRTEIRIDFRKIPCLLPSEMIEARIEVARGITGLKTPNQLAADRGDAPFTGDWQEYGDTPLPMSMAGVGTAKNSTTDSNGNTSPSLGLPGGDGTRDQSGSGEAQMTDTTGRKALGIASMFNAVDRILSGNDKITSEDEE